MNTPRTLTTFGAVLLAGNVFALAVHPQLDIFAVEAEYKGELSGQVRENKDGKLTIQNGEMQATYTLTDQTQVQKNLFSADAAALSEGDTVRLTQNNQGVVSAVTSWSPQIVTFAEWSIPLTMTALALSVVLSIAGRKVQEWLTHHQGGQVYQPGVFAH
jgi:hypothetical protein